MNEHDEQQRARDEERRAHDERQAGRHAEREAAREARRAERDARREERHRAKAEFRSSFGQELRDQIRDEVRGGLQRGLRGGLRGWTFGFQDLGDSKEFRVGSPGSEANEVVERRFEVNGMPTVHVSNVSGETEVTVGQEKEVFVRARKRVHGWSEDRARRVLENVEIVMEQNGDEIVIEPRLFQQERAWSELFRGGRVAVDLDVRVPRETNLTARTVSGELSVTGTRGPIELQSVSGEIGISDVQGPLRLRTVSGDVNASSYAGQLEANSVSGEIEIERSRVRAPDIVTVSGDIELDALVVPVGGPDGRIKTVSGDVEVALGDSDLEIDLKTLSGDTEVDGPARIEKEGRRDRRIIVGAGGSHLRVKTVSGDLTVRMSKAAAPVGTSDEPPIPEEGPPIPMGPPAEDSAIAARDILDRVARGELSVDDAAAALDAARGR